MTTSTFDHLVVTQTPTGSQISGFIRGKTQARLVFTRRGEQMEIVCMTEDLACAELAAIDTLSTWELVSACLEPYRRGVPRQVRVDEAEAVAAEAVAAVAVAAEAVAAEAVAAEAVAAEAEVVAQGQPAASVAAGATLR